MEFYGETGQKWGEFYGPSGREMRRWGKGYIRDMTREEFIKELDEKGYLYEIEGDKIVVIDEFHIDLEYLKILPSDVEFRNGGEVFLESLMSIHPGVVFNNEGGVNLEYLIDGDFSEWKGNIKGIDSKRLLNGMIKRGVFI